MNGIILVDKPSGWTSFDICKKIRNLTREKKVGHGGTLDPFATGLLLVFVGKAVKFSSNFSSGDKGYIGEMALGVKTDTLDSTGVITETKNDFKPFDEGQLKNAFNKYLGAIKQKPPMYSAIKINGKPLYKLARKGQEVERELRDITIHQLEILGIDGNNIKFKVVCSKGTYIRSLADDIGNDLGCGAHLSSLQRFYSHPFLLSQALTIQTIENFSKIGELEKIILPVEQFIF
ncbi:MAG: tRNA pseudouridine55 synthase [Candidatus Saganbacteria bacterium]|uniref:tRNA pseudouridine synthase B n=1 Tax=Candidatus Saganbacteria bacterium TaxID=2575572 RepID=A0A833L1A6_UNCSA|nr:MAG: tRNA pseudouridine55 synthase [Candidatus Saganbacteria bacterium]